MHFGHAADAMSRSRAISTVQSSFAGAFAGSGEAVPFWFTFLKQPFAVVHAGSPYCERYVARSLSALG